MTQSDREILQLVERIQFLSRDGSHTNCRGEDELFFRMAKIRELANALAPRLEAIYNAR